MTNTHRLLIVLSACLIGLGSAGVALSDSDEHEEREEGGYRGSPMRAAAWLPSQPDVRPVDNPLYAEECGACHMAYQPGLLPASAWERIMAPAALVDHYSDDASLADDLRVTLLSYLTANAADQATLTRSRAFAVRRTDSDPAGSASALPRITETAFFLRKHDEIPARLVKDNPDVGSFSQCNKCHQKAETGSYNEDQIQIPGYGRWED